MLHRYKLAVKNDCDISFLEGFLLKENLISGIETDPVLDTNSGVVNIIVLVPNKEKFRRWASPRKKFREAADPRWMLITDPEELESKSAKVRRTNEKKSREKSLKK